MLGKIALLVLMMVFFNQSVMGQANLLTPIGSTLASVTNTDDSYQLVDIRGVFPQGIKFGSNTYTDMYVGSNGYVTFGHGNSGYSPLGIAGYTAGPIIAGQYDDLHPGVSGDIYYSQNTDYVVVTYSAVAPYRTPTGVGSGYNTFQIVLRKGSGYGSTNLNFQIEIRYISLQWAKSGNVSAWPTAGWSTGTGTVYDTGPYSGTSSFLSNASSSNINTTGVFRWDVEGGVVKSAPTVNTTTAASSISGSGAISGGNVSADGGATVTARGVCYSTSQIPTISNGVAYAAAGGTGAFVATLSGLNPGTTYYVRAFATNSINTGYGPQVSFTTASVSAPTVTTTAINNITTSSASSGATVTSDGGATVTAKGVVWNSSGSPTTGNYTGIGSESLTGLTANTTYYVRAYATNSSGTSYGSQVTFTTYPTDPTNPAASSSTICNGNSTQLSVSNGQGTVYWYSGSAGGTYVGTGNPITVYPTTTTTYYAKNVNSQGSSAGYTSGLTINVNQPASQPTSASATATEKTTASLSWGTSTGLEPITYYWAVGTGANVTYESGYTAHGTTLSTDLTSLAATATGLSQSTTYYLRVKAANSCNTAGSAYVTSASFRTHSLLTYTAGANGTISGTSAQTVSDGADGTSVTAVPDAGYNFVNWSDGNTSITRQETTVHNSVSVTANFAPNRLVFEQQPVNKTSDPTDVIPVKVKVTDTYGNIMTNSTAAITLVIQNNPSIGSEGVLGGTVTVNAVSGVAEFTNLWINKTGNGYTLKASSPAPIVTTPISSSFKITPGVIDHFTVDGILANHVAGTTTSPKVTAYDQNNNIKTDYTGTISFSSNNVSSLSTKLTVLPANYSFQPEDNGVKTFTNGVSLKRTGTNFYVKVADGSNVGQKSGIEVTPASINVFRLVANNGQPVTAGVPFSVIATVYDEFDNIKTDYEGENSVNWTTTASPAPNGTARIIPLNGDKAFTAECCYR